MKMEGQTNVYNIITKLNKEEKGLVNVLQIYYIGREGWKVTKSETMRLCLLDLCKFLKIGGDTKQKPRETKKKVLSMNFLSLLQKTNSVKEGVLSMRQIKELADMQDVADIKIANILKEAGFKQKRISKGRRWLAKIAK